MNINSTIKIHNQIYYKNIILFYLFNLNNSNNCAKLDFISNKYIIS